MGNPVCLCQSTLLALHVFEVVVVHFLASSLLKSRYVMRFIDLQVPIATTQTALCGHPLAPSLWYVFL